jgi:hypothetical protein
MNKIISIKEYVKSSNIGPFVFDDQAMCANKWTFLYVNFHGGIVKNCYNVPHRSISTEDLEKYGTDVFFNHPYEIARRQEKLENIKHNDCSNCWECESKGVRSRRQPINFYKVHRGRFNETVSVNPLPTFLELYFSNACDLKCLYCNNQFSSQWEAELRKFNEPFHTMRDNTNGLLKTVFYKWFEKEGCENILTYNILGGEPTTQNDFYEFADYLIGMLNHTTNKHSIRPEICITTNGNTPAKYMDKFVDVLNKLSDKMSIRIDFSNGSVGTRSEFVRTGLSWEIFETNVNRITSFAKGKDIRIRFNCAHTALTVPTFIDFLKWAHELQHRHGVKISFSTNTVVQPSNLSPWNLTDDFKSDVEKCIQYIRESAPEWITYIDYLETLKNGIGKYNINDLKTIPRWASQLKDRRGIDFLETFPELQNWYKFCNKVADNDKN